VRSLDDIVIDGRHVDGLRLDAVFLRKGQLDRDAGAGAEVELGVRCDRDRHIAGGQRVQEHLVGIARRCAFGHLGAAVRLADRDAGRLELPVAQVDTRDHLAGSQVDRLPAGGAQKDGQGPRRNVLIHRQHVVHTIAVHVGGSDRLRLIADSIGDRRGKRPVAAVHQQRDAVRFAVRHDEVRKAVAVEIPRGGVHGGRAGGIRDAAGEIRAALIQDDRDIVGIAVGRHQVEVRIAVKISRGKTGRHVAHGDQTRPSAAQTCRAVQHNQDIVAVPVRHRDVVEQIAVEVTDYGITRPIHG